MQVLVLATGEENKLHPLTQSIPTPMVPIANRPVMALVIELLARYYLKNVIISLYDRASNIEAYFHQGSRWGLQLDYLLQREPLGSAGAIKWAESQINQSFLVLPADSIIDLDIKAAMEAHRKHGGPVTMILHETLEGDAPQQPIWVRPDGSIVLDETEGKLLSVTKAYIFEPSIFELIPADTHYDCYTQLLPQLLEAGIDVHSYVTPGYWNPLNSFASYQEAQDTILQSAIILQESEGGDENDNQSSLKAPPFRHPSIEGAPFSKGIWVGRDNIIHPNVRLTPPVYLGNGCRIGNEVELGPNAVIGSHVIIDNEATVRNSTILDYTYVGQLVNLDDRIVNRTLLIDVDTAESTEVVDEFLLSEASPTSVGGSLRRLAELVTSLLLLILTWQITCLIGLMTFITTGGSLFRRVPYIAKGPGRIRFDSTVKPQTFHLLHFQTRRTDGSFTWLGEFLEKWHLHRLPELWNVVQGELSFVGVKPLSSDEHAKITEEWQQKRYESPAGMTGLWYIQDNVDSDFDELLIADAYYAATRNWRNDGKLLLQTPAAWLKKVTNV